MIPATTPRRPRQIKVERGNLDVGAIVEVAREEELSEDAAMRGIETDLPSIPLAESIPKPIKEEDISIGKASVSEREEREEFFTGERRRSYIADVKEAIKKSRQKVRERSKKHESKDSVETPRLEEYKKSSLGGAGTVGLFTPLQLV
jgi:hypothetical protein